MGTGTWRDAVVSVRLFFAWWDAWVGAYWDRRQRRLYICPIPMLGVVVQFRRPKRKRQCRRCAHLTAWHQQPRLCEAHVTNSTSKEAGA